MKAIRLILVSAMLINCYAVAQIKKTLHPAIQFVNKDWKTVLATAKKLHKPIFVDAYAAWCMPCREMKRHVFTNRKIAESFNARFINFTIDVEKNAGVSFADHYEVTAYPTLLFIDSDGRVIKQTEGYMDAKSLEAFAADID